MSCTFSLLLEELYAATICSRITFAKHFYYNDSDISVAVDLSEQIINSILSSFRNVNFRVLALKSDEQARAAYCSASALQGLWQISSIIERFLLDRV
jgi:hypothetical protein